MLVSTNFKMPCSEENPPTQGGGILHTLLSVQKIPFSANICASQLHFGTSHPLLLGQILIFLLSFGLHTMGWANCLETWLANVLEISQVLFILKGSRPGWFPFGGFMGCLWVDFGYCPKLRGKLHR